MQITRVPLELLANIFLATECFSSCVYNSDPRHQDNVYPTTLASVCRSWRNLALGLRWLWSHIDLEMHHLVIPEVQAERVQLFIERSTGTTVDLTIRVSQIPEDMESTQIPPPDPTAIVVGLIRLLAPLALRVRRLEIYSEVYEASQLQPILSCIVALCPGGALNTLIVRGASKPNEASNALLPWLSSSVAHPPTSRQVCQVFGPLQALHLQNAHIPWLSCAYRGLTELVVCGTGHSGMTTCEQIRNVLASCPRLRILCLKKIHLSSRSNQLVLQPVQLKDLRSMELVPFRPGRLAPLIRCLRFANQPLIVKLLLSKEAEFAKRLRTFLSKGAKVATLRIRPEEATSWFAALYSVQETLDALTLQDCDFADPRLQCYTKDKIPLRRSVLWPSLRTLRLECCILDPRSLRCLVNGNRMEHVILIKCQVRDPESLVPVAAERAMFYPHFADLGILISVTNGL